MSKAIVKTPKGTCKLPDDLKPSTAMDADDWKDKVDKRFREVLWRAAVDPRLYPCGKLAIGWMLGRGDLARSGQTPSIPAGSTTIFQNIKIYLSMSEEEKERLREQYRRAAIEGAIPGLGSDPGNGLGALEDQERPALVAAELHQDV